MKVTLIRPYNCNNRCIIENFQDLGERWKAERTLLMQYIVISDDSSVIFKADSSKITLEVVV